MRRRVRFKMDDRFIRSGVAEFFAREAFNRFRIVAQGVNFTLEILGDFRLFLDFDIQPVNFAAVIFILPDQRQISHADEQQDGDGDERDDGLRQLAPDAEINFHARSLGRTPQKPKRILLSFGKKSGMLLRA
jgi:hypothetical protein